MGPNGDGGVMRAEEGVTSSSTRGYDFNKLRGAVCTSLWWEVGTKTGTDGEDTREGFIRSLVLIRERYDQKCFRNQSVAFRSIYSIVVEYTILHFSLIYCALLH